VLTKDEARWIAVNVAKLPDPLGKAVSIGEQPWTRCGTLLFMALLSFVESAPRAYRLKVSNAAPSILTSSGTIPSPPPDTTSTAGRAPGPPEASPP
jgi:hypothetical protein